MGNHLRTVLTFGALLLITGAVAQTSDEPASGRMLVIGHRGAPAFGGENTLAGFRKAVELGAHGVELDLILTANYRLAVIHDFDLNRLASEAQLDHLYPDRSVIESEGERLWPTRGFTLEELKALRVTQRGSRAAESTMPEVGRETHIPDYSEALALLDEIRRKQPDFILYTEIKASAEHMSPEEIDLVADRVAESLASAGELEHPKSHWLQSFDARVMDRLARDPRLDRFAKAQLLSCEPGLTSGASPVILDTNAIRTESDLRAFLDQNVASRGMSIVHGWKLMWFFLETERGIDCAAVAHGLGLQIHAFTFRDDRFTSDYEKYPELAPKGSPFHSPEEEAAFFRIRGYDALLSDSIDTALPANTTQEGNE